jgi:NAD(P)-dependent dehydrogenase (short-subunit alcohol dehydrogenase family)
MDLTNAAAIVTGGAGGVGSATVRRRAQMGATVVIAAVSAKRGEALAREVDAGSLYVPTDGMDENAIATAVKAAAGLGPLRAAVQTSPRHAATFASDNRYWPLGRTHAYGCADGIAGRLRSSR